MAAYSSTKTEVLDAYQAYLETAEEVRLRRAEMRDRYGRELYVQTGGFTRSQRVIGFERIDTDDAGACLGDEGELRVPRGRGKEAHIVKPNLARASGKRLREELSALTLPGLKLPGMPEFVLIGLTCRQPGILFHDGVLWAMWGDADLDANETGGQVDTTLWTAQPLSVYYAAAEAAGEA